MLPGGALRTLRGGVLVASKIKGATSRETGGNAVEEFLRGAARESFWLDQHSLKGGRSLRRVKIGHLGTLDPMATGVLPVAFGNATRLADHLPLEPKRYVARLRLGEATDTGDAEGRVVEIRPVPALPSAGELEQQLLRSFVGRVTQTPPRYSAVHINGERAYDLARRNVDFVVPSREVTVHACSARAVRADELELDVLCGTGTYVRSLGEDIARALGTCGHLVALHRSGSGMFREGARAFYTTEELLAHLPRLDSPLPLARAVAMAAQGRPVADVLQGVRLPDQPGDYALFGQVGAQEPVALALVRRLAGASGFSYVTNLCIAAHTGPRSTSRPQSTRL